MILAKDVFENSPYIDYISAVSDNVNVRKYLTPLGLRLNKHYVVLAGLKTNKVVFNLESFVHWESDYNLDWLVRYLFEMNTATISTEVCATFYLWYWWK